MTEWRAVVGYEGFYEVSDEGKVRSLPRTIPRSNGRPLVLRGRLLRLASGRGGYPVAALCRDGKKVERRVHRLVLEAFVGPAPEGQEGCHSNDIKTDNRLSNLRWDTPVANCQDRTRNGRDYQASKTHCAKGHPYDEANTRQIGKYRQCRTCVIDNKRRWRLRQKETAA